MSSTRVGFDLRLEQIAEHVDAGANFRDAGETFRMQRGG